MTSPTWRASLALAATVRLLGGVGWLCLDGQEAIAQTLDLQLRADTPAEELHQDQPLFFTTVFTNPGPGVVSFGLTSLGWRDRPGFLIVPLDENPIRTYGQVPVTDEGWSDRYWLGPTFEPNVPVARVDLLRMWASGDHRFQARLTDWDGKVYTSNVVELTVEEAPPDHPLRPLLEEANQDWDDFGFRLVESYYYRKSVLRGDRLERAADILRQADDDGQWSAWLEVVAGLELFERFGQAASPRRHPREKTGDPAEALRLCEWFEQRFPDSPLLSQLRLYKGFLIAEHGRVEEARQLVRAERERSPIARLLYGNFAATSADPYGFFKDQE